MGKSIDIKKIAMIGCGSMGGGMALLFAEKGLQVMLQDPSEEAVDKILSSAKEAGFGDRVHKHEKYDELCASLDTPRVLVFSLPHGTVGDGVLNGLLPYLENGDIILDAGNEHFKNTERRQGITTTKGIRYVGMGVSGGYQAARRGPSMCPGGDEETLEMVLPLLRKVAAKDPQGRSCVGRCGLGGSGHYVKMMHNGIEHGMMSAIAEAWKIMEVGLKMSHEEIGDVLEKWNEQGQLRGTFLIRIGADICRTKIPDSPDKTVLSTVADKVVQDLTGEEGTGIWSNEEAVTLHIPAPTLTTAHYFRLASAYRGDRVRVHDQTSGGFPPQPLQIDDRPGFIEKLRQAVYAACLSAYIQGVRVIEAADKEHKWAIDYGQVWQIWRAGCIIQADYISDELLKPVFCDRKDRTSVDLLHKENVIKQLKDTYAALKTVVAAAVQHDHVVPSLSATLEWIKYSSNTDLPASFYEAQLDYFGKHMYDEVGEDAPGPTEGKHHFEWKPA